MAMNSMATRERYQPRVPITAATLWDAICNRMSRAVCRQFHGEVSLPVSGRYYCLKCKREFNSNW
ncbi:MAG TPA: hypothetical protein VLY24_27050 [Bryobacteraceae bacterium]|nr:hypothetical protein [Bryobacteraceae bacterium]